MEGGRNLFAVARAVARREGGRTCRESAPSTRIIATVSASTGSSSRNVERANALVRLFAEPGPGFASFRPVSAAEIPQPARGLLDHDSHMTVAMERLHGTPLGLRVVARARDAGVAAPWYAREILLLSPEGEVVQHGIVRIDLSHVDAATAARIRAARVPQIGRAHV